MSRSKGTISQAGWAEFENGKLKDSGVIDIGGAPEKKDRLRQILSCLQEDFADKYDVLVIEEIKGYRAQQVLIQACGVFIAGTTSDAVIEANVQSWQAIAKRLGTWEKDDESDAIHIGAAALAWASGFDLKKEKREAEAMEAVINETRERIIYESSTIESEGQPEEAGGQSTEGEGSTS